MLKVNVYNFAHGKSEVKDHTPTASPNIKLIILQFWNVHLLYVPIPLKLMTWTLQALHICCTQTLQKYHHC